MLSKVKYSCNFFLNSLKHEGLLSAVVTTGVIEISRHKPLLDLCRTRWAERHDAYRNFYQAYMFIVKALELIGHGIHSKEFAIGWDSKARSNASCLLAGICNFEFIITFLTAYQFLFHLTDIIVRL